MRILNSIPLIVDVKTLKPTKPKTPITLHHYVFISHYNGLIRKKNLQQRSIPKFD